MKKLREKQKNQKWKDFFLVNKMIKESKYSEKQQQIMLNSVYRTSSAYTNSPDVICVPYEFEVYKGENAGITGKWFDSKSGKTVSAIGHWDWGQITANNFVVEDSERLRASVPKDSDLVKFLDEKGYAKKVQEGTRINDLTGVN